MIQPQGSRWRSPLVIVSLCFAVVAASAALRSPATSPPPPPPPAPPTAVAIVNLKTFFDGLTEFKEGMEVIGEKGKTSEARLKEANDALTKAIKDYELLKNPTFSVQIDQQAKIAELKELRDTRKAVLTRVLEVEAGNLMRKVFLKAVDAGDRLAAKDGWDIILIDDRSIVPPERASSQNGEGRRIRMDEVEQIIQQRRILSAVKRVDITASLIEFMNAEFKAGKK